MTYPKYLELPIDERECADWGHATPSGERPTVEVSWHHYRSVCVCADGDVLALDSVSDTYSRHHDLTDLQISRARKLAEAS